ncbi:MAG: hypothetical protein J6T51_02605 [Kiritimatiellae bacterium]|nr:hypothetical protein [Kiritimatiellia bacterium]
MKKGTFAMVAVAACAAAGGFAVGRMGVCRNAETAPAVRQGDGEKSSAALEKANRRIAELERALSGARQAAKAAGSAGARATEEVVSVGTNADILAELKRRLPETEFVAATNALSGLRRKLAERAKGRMEYLASVDVSRMTKAERENHAKFLELMERREAAAAKMKCGLPDAKTLEEMVALELEIQPVAKAARSALVREVARELGYSGDDVEVLHDTLDTVFDCTSSGGLGGLVDMGSLMEASDGQPGVSVHTQVMGL